MLTVLSVKKKSSKMDIKETNQNIPESPNGEKHKKKKTSYILIFKLFQKHTKITVSVEIMSAFDLCEKLKGSFS